MRVATVHFVFAVHPGLFIVDLLAPLRLVVIMLGGPSEVLHPMRVVAVAPIVFFIENGAERRFVRVEQELL